jgi:bifunctional non-homologous end joining protein LigD
MTLPSHVKPMLATSGKLPGNDGWAYEIKWDGVRALAYVDGKSLHLESRNLLDITARYPELSDLPSGVSATEAILDGEVVAFDEHGKPSFSTLQRRMHVADAHAVRAHVTATPILYAIFDVLFVDGESLMERPWTERRAVLDDLVTPGDRWRVPASHSDGAALADASRAQGLEGIVAKRTKSLYVPGRRSADWVKVKNIRRQEVVVGGWLAGAGRREGTIGAIIVGVYEGDDLRFAGKVGTGFTDAELDRVSGILAPLSRPTSPFVNKVPYKQARFVEPVLIAETTRTPGRSSANPPDAHLRQNDAPGRVVLPFWVAHLLSGSTLGTLATCRGRPGQVPSASGS